MDPLTFLKDVMRRDIEVILKRAESFIKDALEDLKRGDYWQCFT